VTNVSLIGEIEASDSSWLSAIVAARGCLVTAYTLVAIGLNRAGVADCRTNMIAQASIRPTPSIRASAPPPIV
jgi:hypothetical protein